MIEFDGDRRTPREMAACLMEAAMDWTAAHYEYAHPDEHHAMTAPERKAVSRELAKLASSLGEELVRCLTA